MTMSRTTKWKLEKVKVKVVFRLQFHATHVPQAGWDKLFVSLIPGDSGKVTAKTSKSHIRNGTCKWADPIYETTRLLQDTKTKQYEEKLYRLAVAMGSSRSSLLGEVNINLADYADASKPSSVALPLHGCNFGSVLHVTVQLLTSKTGFREFEQQSELREGGLQTTTHQDIHNERSEKLSSSAEMVNDQIEKVNSRVRFQSESSEIPSLGEVELTEDYADSAVGIDDSSNTSESLYTEKHDSSTHENESLKSTISGDLGGIPLNHIRPEKGDPSDHRLSTRGGSDWVHGWSSDYSMDNDLVSVYEENNRLRGSLEMAESSILELKLGMSSLQSHADEFGGETQKCLQLLAKEMASGEELAKEVSVLKSECSKFKSDLQQLNCSKLNAYLMDKEIISKNSGYLFQDLHMRWLRVLLTMEDKVSEIQNKACHRGPEQDLRFLHQDLEDLHQVIQDLKQDTSEATSLLTTKLTEQADAKEMRAESVLEPVDSVQGDKLDSIDAYQYHFEGMSRLDQAQESCSLDVTISLRNKLSGLQRELEESKTEQDNLTRKLDQMECYYETYIRELEENQKQLLGELHGVRNEHSACMFTITSCNSQMEKMHENMNEQLLRFSEERCELESVNMELERKVISSENALKRARWNSSIAVDQLQKDLELLSFQVLSLSKTNENLIRQAFAETSQYGTQEYPEDSSGALELSLDEDYASVFRTQYKTKLQGRQAEVIVCQQKEQVPGSEVPISLAKVIKEKKNFQVLDEVQSDSDNLDSSFRPNTLTDSKFSFLHSNIIELQQCQNEKAELERQLCSTKILLDDSQRSLHLQEELYQKVETELFEMHLLNINLDVFSKVLQEAICEANNGINVVNEKMNALAQKLAHSTECEELLTLRLQTALEDVNTLMEHNSNWSTRCDELTLHNQIVEQKFHSMSNENGYLTQKIIENERMIMDYRSFEGKYEDCIAERTELVNLLKKESLIKCSLQDEVSTMHEELKTLKAAADEQSSVNGNLEKTLLFLREKLEDLRSTMSSYDDHITGTLLSGPILDDIEHKDLTSTVLHLEELQKKACEKILELTREKNDVEKQRDTAQGLLAGVESEIVLMKKKHELDVQGMLNKLILSTDLVDKLHLELENVSNKLKITLESEESYTDQLEGFSSKLSFFEVELQNVNNENRDLAQKIRDLECVSKELESTKLTVIDSAHENQALRLSLKSGGEESAQLSNELNVLMEKFRCTREELNSERSLKVKLEGVIADLTSELKIKNNLLNSLDRENDEVFRLKQLVSDLELEKSRVSDLLLQSEESLRKGDENASSLCLQVTGLETHLSASQEYSLAADVELICTRNQFQTRMQELVQQLESLDGCYRELHLKHLNFLTTLNGRISSEAQYVEENARLLAVLDSLKSELEASTIEKSALRDTNNVICAELEKYKAKEVIAKCRDINNNHQHEHEIAQLEHMLSSSEELVDNLKFSRDELEITVAVLRAKLDDQRLLISLLDEYDSAVISLQNQKSELSQRLSEQILKTEEFKNLSVHLKELKDKADAECLETREKREIEVPSNALQESLRMAFIREQCETKVQELRSQLFLSKKHGEEMLLKLQDAMNEVEDRRKCEASHRKRNEELLMKISELETELQMTLADKWEKVNAVDKMRAELECSLMSLDCCKEEKQKLEATLQKCTEERTKFAVELGLVKKNLKISALSPDILNGGNCKPNAIESMSTQPVTDDALCEEDSCGDSMQDCHTLKNVNGVSRQIVINHDSLRQLTLLNEHFKAQSFKSSMEHLYEELERMKNENLVSHPIDGKQLEPVFHGLQRHLVQLHKANEQLGNIFPLFNEFPGSENALERVLALEIELAEALQAKKKSSIHFQSSFLKQHADEEAMFRSFRDINELIKEMLELMGRFMAKDTELKEMHDRYSQLSLQFAEVEGERQKLLMRLKNARSPKKTLHLDRSTSASLEDQS